MSLACYTWYVTGFKWVSVLKALPFAFGISKNYFSMYKLEELIANNKMDMKDNISYLGNGVDLINAVKQAREHFDTLQQDFERNFDDGVILKVHK